MTWRSLSILLLWVFFCCTGTIAVAQITVDFTADVVEGCSSVQANFSDQSTSTAGKIVSWKWDLAGAESNLENPGRIFASVGSYEICLTVKDESGNEKQSCKEDFIRVYDLPKADFGVDIASGCAPLLVSYLDLSSTPNGKITQWTWGLNGSNGIVETSNPDRQIFSEYQTADLYTISLSITDEKGCSNSITKSNLLEVFAQPEINISTMEPIGCSFPMTVDYRNLGPSENISYFWDFGNGQQYEGYDPDPVVYSTEAPYDLQIIAVNNLSQCRDTLLFSDYVNSGGTILFDFYPQRICKGGEVQFEDQSPIEAESWIWNFGDGSTSTERDPSHTYDQVGTYRVSLSRKTSECEGVQVSEYEVTVDAPPTLDFDIEVVNSCKLPAEVNFTENSNEPGVYRWYLGKPGSYTAVLTEPESTFEFTEYGAYEVRLLKDSDIGCRNIKLIDTIDIQPLKINLTGRAEGCVPFTADLGFNSNSEVPISSVQWSISGDQSLSSTEERIELDIDEVSNYFLELAVENELGCVDTIKGDDILRGGIRPQVDFAISDTVICPKDLISFTNLSTGTADSWVWTFNDSTIVEEQNPEQPFNSPGAYKVEFQVGHNGCYSSVSRDSLFMVNFPAVGFELEYNCDDPYSVKAISTSSSYDSLVWNYSVKNDTVYLPFEDSILINFPDDSIYILSLEAFNYENGCDNSVSDTVWISDPKAAFNTSINEGCTPLRIQFIDESVDAVSWKYFTEVSKFSDDTIPDPILQIRPKGEYDDIGLIITDRHGCQDTAYSDLIKVNQVEASFLIPDPVCINDTLRFIHTATSEFSSISDLKWVLGSDLDTSYQEDAAFVMSEVGKHDVKLVAEDEWGCKDSTTIGLAAFFRAPNFELAADSLSCTSHEIDFRNLLHANNYFYEWSFGDGDSSTLTNPQHLYEEEGDYEVSVRIKDTEGCVNEIKPIQVVKVADPVASFTAENTFTACPPLGTIFENNSLNSSIYTWDFGDDSGLSSEESPSHLYIKAGVFDVSLIAERTAFCKDTFLISDLIQLDGPKGEFTFEVDSSCVPLKVSFEATLAEDYRLIWDFGDGNLEVVDSKTDYSQVEYSYLDPGNFIPKIILEDNENCKITREGDPIETHALEAGFTALDSIFCNNIPGEVNLQDDSYSTSPILSYEWRIAGDTYTSTNPAFTPVDTGRFDVVLTVENAFCADTLTKKNFIKVGDAPILAALPDTFNCIHTEMQLQARSSNSSDNIIWFDANGEALTSGNGLVLTNLETSSFFTIEATNEYQCVSRDTVHVELIDDQTAFSGPDRTICDGSETNITIGYGQEIKWPADVGCDTCFTVTLSPDTLTIYPIEIKNEYGCIVKDTLQVDVLYQEDIEAGDDQSICIGDQALLLAFVEGDIKWSPANLVHDQYAQLAATNIQESTMFYLESTKDECTLKDSIYINMIDKARVEAIGDTICYGDMAQIYAQGDIDDVRWETEDGVLSDAEIMNPTTMTTETSQYMVIGMLTGCTPDTAYAEVMVYPEIRGHLPEERNYFSGEEEVEVNLQMSSDGNYAFTWMPQEMVDCVTCSSVNVTTADSTQMISVEIMERETGCADTLNVMIREFSGCESASAAIGVPNVFSPNEDGINDLLNIEANAFEDINLLSIYDRWGEQVFVSRSLSDSWDGRHNGDLVQSGVYTYVVKATCPDTGEEVYASGDVTVLR